MIRNDDLYDDTAPGSAHLPLNAQAVLGFLRRQAWLISSFTIVSVCVAWIVASQLTPLYTATAQVLFTDQAQRLLGNGEFGQRHSVTQEAVASYAVVMRSEHMLRRALLESGLAQTLQQQAQQRAFSSLFAALAHELDDEIGDEEDRASDAVLNALVADIQDDVSVIRERQTLVISISVQNEVADTSARLANALGEAFIHHQIQTLAATARSAEEALIQRVADLAHEDRVVQTRIDQLLVGAASAYARETRQITQAETDDVLSRMQHVQSERLALLSEHESISQFLRLGDAGDSLLFEEAVQTTQATRARLTTIASRLMELQAVAQNARPSLANLIDQAGGNDGVLALQLETATQELASIEHLFAEALEQLNRARFSSTSQIANAQLISPAIPPLEPSYPSLSLALALGFVLGSGLGVGTGLLREQLFEGVVDPDAVERALKTAVAAVIPCLKPNDALAPASHIIDKPISDFSESIRRLSLALSPQASDGASCTCVLFTSPNAGEGKTTMALAYASQMAASGKKTLLLDADFRNPTLHKRLAGEIGTVEHDFMYFLKSTLSLSNIADIGVRHARSGLVVLPNFQSDQSSTDDLIVGSRFGAVMAAARTFFDIIVIDSPPVLPIVDARLLQRQVDRVCLTLRYGSTSLPEVRAALDELAEPGSPPVVCALNMSEPTPAHYYGSGNEPKRSKRSVITTWQNAWRLNRPIAQSEDTGFPFHRKH